MSLLYFALALLVFSNVLTISSSNLCQVVTTSTDVLHKGKQLQGYQFYKLNRVLDIVLCARMCFFRRRCLSFNYNAKATICEFNNAYLDPPEATLKDSVNFTYSKISQWNKAIGSGPCSEQPCAICEACYPTENNYTCVKEELTSCRDIRLCTNSTTDGHYLVRPVMGSNPWLKVYCHNLSSTYPRDFLTLPQKNYFMYPPIYYKSCDQIHWTTRNPGVMYYQKIRLDLTILKVYVKDKTFTTISCNPALFGMPASSFASSGATCKVNLDYGYAGDCMWHTCNPRRGKVHVDLRDTGLAVSPSVNWISGGYISRITSQNRSPSNQEITVVCGGNCGMCYPKNDGLILEPFT